MIHPGVVIPPGDYQWNRYRVMVNTASKRPWEVNFQWWWGMFYSGTRRQIQLGLVLKPSRHLLVKISGERNDVSLESDFFTQLFQLRVDYSYSPDISWSNFIQYDNASRILGVQSRLRFILKPGNDLFVVVHRGWENLERGSIKFQYTFRL